MQSELKQGAALPELSKEITQDNINLYAEASRDFNPIHIDEEFARNTPLGGTIAHGMLILAYVSQMMTSAFGRSWLVGGKLNARFKAPARPGDRLTVGGAVRSIEKRNGHSLVTCDYLVTNQKGEQVLAGVASVKIETAENSS